MDEPAFFEIFTRIQLNEDDRERMQGVHVTSIRIDRNTRTVELALTFPCSCPPLLRDRLHEQISELYKLENVDIKLNCCGGPFGEQEVSEILADAMNRFPALVGFLKNCGLSYDNNEIVITGANGFTEVITSSGFLRYMEQTAWICYAKRLRVTIRPDNEEVAEKKFIAFEKNRDEELQRLMKESSSATTRKEKREEVPAAKKDYSFKKRPPAPKVCEEDILLGKPFGEEPVPITSLDLNGGWYAVRGDVFGSETKEVSNGTMLVVAFNVTDGKSSVRCKRIFKIADGQEFAGRIHDGDCILVRGEIMYDNFEKDSVMKPVDILKAKKILRMDEANEKRVELHLHTKMSAMDGVVSAKDVVKTAVRWGHKAVAVTDHGVLHAFPDMLHAKDKQDIKILYGCEGYYVNNTKESRVLFGQSEEPLTGDYVCFDLETTGLSAQNDCIIEIAASLLRDGRIIDTFQTYVNPERAIPQKITELTGINMGMVMDAPKIGKALRAFLDFAGKRVLCAHNASFDIGFLKAVTQREGLSFDNAYIDSLPLSRVLLPQLSRFKLNTIAKELNLPKFKHHSGSDDARTLALMLAEFFNRLSGEGVTHAGQLNDCIHRHQLENAKQKLDTGSLPVYHILLLAKNVEGVIALNELVSMGHLEYMNSRKTPIMPRSELINLRENLIVGSACEAGELFRAMVDGADDEELCEIASFYDFLEVQPIGNNAFMLREGTVSSEEELRNFNRRIVAIADKLGKPAVATGDVHFLNPEDEAYRRILMAAKGFEDCDQQAPLYFRTTDDMLNEFSYFGEEKAYELVVKNTNMIADMIEDFCPFPEKLYPPEIPGSKEELVRITRTEAANQYGDPLPEQVSVILEKELNSITKHGFDVMYMFAQKLIKRSNECGYMVGSRGSVGSSLVAYFLGITEVNALPPHYRCLKCRYTEFHSNEGIGSGFDMEDKNCPKCGEKLYKDGFDIPFETFLGFDGDKEPDIDLNFSNEYQSKAHRHTIEMFGKENVFRAGTIGTVAEKTAFGYVKKYCEERGITMPKAEMARLAIGCTDVKRTTGQHPGGMVVVPRSEKIYKFCAVQHPADDQETDTVITHVDYHSIDKNLLKFDILGHKDPTMIKHLEELTGMKMSDVDLNDKATLSLYSSIEALGIEDEEIFGEVGTCAVPEFGTKFVKQVLVDTRPASIDELVRVCGMTHGTDVWLNNAQDIIANGYAPLSGCICCRDDIMLNLISWGMPPKMSFQIMEFVRKGKGLKPEWEEAMVEHKVPEWYIESCKKIKYMFPKAHAAAYVINGFRVAWFKLHKPLAFYCAFLSVRADALDADVMLQGTQAIRDKIIELRNKEGATQVEQDLSKNLEVCYEFCLRGFSFVNVDIYGSKATDFSMLGETQLRLPFNAVPGLGDSAAQNLYEEAHKEPFLSIEDISQRCNRVSGTLIEKLRSMGVFGNLPESCQSTLI